MHSFEEKKREILDRIDLVGLVSEHASLKRSGRRWVGLCPFHSEKTPSFTVNPDLGLFKCFGCGKGGDVFSFVQEMEGMPFKDAMRFLADRAGVDLEYSRSPGSDGPSRMDIADVNGWAMSYFRRQLRGSAGERALAYLSGRGFSAETIDRFQLGYASEDGQALIKQAAGAGFNTSMLLAADLLRSAEGGGRSYPTFRNRVLFPIQDVSGRVLGFGGRTLADDPAKYLNTRQTALFDKGRQLYGLPFARDAISRAGFSVVVEGYTDCLAAHQAGFEMVVATLGTALTDSHVAHLKRYADEMVVLFDSDRAGEAAAGRAINLAVPAGMQVRMGRLPDGQDPGDFIGREGREGFDRVLKGAQDALEFKWRQTQSRFSSEGSDGRRREAIMDFLETVAQATATRAVDSIQRGLLINQVAHLLQMGRDEVAGALQSLLRKSQRGEESPAQRTEVSTTPGREQAAWVSVLEVLLNEPALFGGFTLPDPDRIADERDRRIAGAVWSLSKELGEFEAADVCARFSDPEDLSRLTALIHRGRERGNYENTLRIALERIGHAVADDGLERDKKELAGADGGTSADVERQRLSQIGDGLRARRGYVPRRMAHRQANAMTPTTVQEQPTTSTLEQDDRGN